MAKTLDYAPPVQSPSGPSNGIWLAAAGAIVLAVVVLLTQVQTTLVAIDGAIDVLTALAWCAAGAGLSPIPLRDKSDEHGGASSTFLLRAVTHIALGLGVMGLLFLLLGLTGLLGQGTVIAVLVGGIALLGLRTRLKGDRVRSWTSRRGWGGAVLLAFAVPLGLALVCASMAPGFLWKPLDPHPYDVMSYHLQVPREWFDAGKIIPLTHNAFSYFPMAMEVHYLAAMHLWGGPWAGMYLCQMLTLTHGVLAVIAVVGVAEALGAPRKLAVMGGLLAATVPWTLMLSTVCYVEAGVMLYTVLAFGWAAYALRLLPPRGTPCVGVGVEMQSAIEDDSTRQPPPNLPRGGRDQMALLIAFLCAGFACGFKYTSFAMVAAPLVVLWPIVAIVSKRLTAAQTIRSLLPAACCLLLVVSPWLARNVVWTSNPVFPLATSVFGKAHFTDEQVTRYQRAHQPPAAEASIVGRVSKGFERTVTDFQFGYVLIPLTIAASLLLVRRPEGVLLIVLMLAMVGVWLFATHVMPRFVAPMIPVMGVVCAMGAAAVARRASPAASWGLGVMVVLQALIALPMLMSQLNQPLAMARSGLFRLPDFSALEAPEVTDAKLRGRKVALIGEAQAFFYTLPSASMRYSTVFDLASTTDRSIDRWLGPSASELERDGYTVIYNAPEAERLTQSYHLQWRNSAPIAAPHP